MSTLQMRSLTSLCAAMLCTLLISAASVAQQPETPAKPVRESVTPQSRATPAPAPGQGVRRPPRGRLPAYFSAVVSQQQREQIYAIQAQHNERIAALRMQIDQMLAQLDKEVDGVLTPKQLSDVNEKRKAAAERRQSRRSRPPATGNQEPR